MRPVRELEVARDVVAVSMGVGHHQPVLRARMAGQPPLDQRVDRRAQREVRGVGRRSGVQQQRSFVPEQQEEERGFEMHGLVLPQDHGVFVVGMRLYLRGGVVLRRGPAGMPLDVEAAGEGRGRTEIDHETTVRRGAVNEG